MAQKKDKKPRPLEEILRELQGKVIKAAQELQQELADSAEKPALDGSTTAADEDPVLLARLKERQRNCFYGGRWYAGVSARMPVFVPPENFFIP